MRLSVAFVLIAALAASSQEKGKRIPQGEGIEAGKEASNFKLKKLKKEKDEKDETVELSSFKDKKPVLLIFGSYT